MKLENQVVSLELAKKLKELGVKQASLFYWVRRDMQADDSVIQVMQNRIHESYGETLASAFTVAELGEMLPSDIVSGKTPNCTREGERECLDFIEFASAAYHHDDTKQKKPRFIVETEANARAKMLIYLLENKLITL